jgi:hypothetical protein
MASTQKQARWRGSNFERRVGKLIHGVVVGRSKAVKVGEKWIQTDCQRPPDVVNEWLSVECKYMKALPKCMTEPLTQAIRNAPDGLIPAVFAGDRQGNRVVIMTENDFLDLHER